MIDLDDTFLNESQNVFMSQEGSSDTSEEEMPSDNEVSELYAKAHCEYLVSNWPFRIMQNRRRPRGIRWLHLLVAQSVHLGDHNNRVELTSGRKTRLNYETPEDVSSEMNAQVRKL